MGIWSESGGSPNQSLGTLTSSSGNAFTHTGIDLLPNTAYFVVVDVSTVGRSVSWANTRSDDEDARKAPGWSIFNMSHSRGINASNWGTFSQSRKIRVNGVLKGATNTPPVARAGSVRTNEDTDYTFTNADFRFADADSGDALEGVTIVTLPASGTGALTLSGSEVSANDAVTKTQLDNGNLKYNPPANANGDAYTSFGFKVSDGTVESPDSYDMTINVRPVNDSPTGDLAIQGTAKLGKDADGGYQRPGRRGWPADQRGRFHGQLAACGHHRHQHCLRHEDIHADELRRGREPPRGGEVRGPGRNRRDGGAR